MKRIPVLTTLTARWRRMVLVFGVLGLWTVMIFALVPSVALGAVPQLINFQGILKDGSGNPVANGNYSVIFTIYDAPAGGTVQWAETTSVTTSSGLFSVLLGSLNLVPDSAFNNPNRWLGIKVGADPEMTPRQQLVSVAYSLRVAHFTPNFGTDNTFIGRDAGNLTMSGSSNTASGAGALQSNTDGSDNTASGASSLFNNTTGSANTASGEGALYSNTTGRFNTASGVRALRNNTDGSDNTASGNFALNSNTIGSGNTASGIGALYFNTTGSLNTASGHTALFFNTTGFGNTASGYEALFNNTIGDSNTAIGYNADVSAGNLTNATAIGYGAVVDASNKIRLGNSFVTLVETDGNIKVGANDTVFSSNLSSNSPLSLQAPAGNTRIYIDDVTGSVGIGTNSPKTQLQVNGPIATSVTITATNLTLNGSHSVVLCNNNGSDITITLPLASGCPGRQYVIKKTGAGSNNATIVPSGSDTIEDGSLISLEVGGTCPYCSYRLVSDGVSNWYTIQ